MKKVLLLTCFFIPMCPLTANPIPEPAASISEFMFQPGGRWELEVSFSVFGGLFLHENYDSICLGSSSGISRIRLDGVRDSTAMFVVTPDSLTAPLSVNPHGDCIRLISYVSMSGYLHRIVDSVAFGDYPGSVLDTIPAGYSLCRVSFSVFSLDKDPTMGVENDTSGICGTLRGNIYNGDGTKIRSGNYLIGYPDLHPIMLYGDGSYSAGVYSMKFRSTELGRVTTDGGLTSVRIDTLRYSAYPDSVIERDIHLEEVVGIHGTISQSDGNVSITNYPNPFNLSTSFAVEIPNDIHFTNGWIDIYNLIGQRVYSVSLRTGSSPTWNGVDSNGKTAGSGVYYYRLRLDDTVYKTGSMILLK